MRQRFGCLFGSSMRMRLRLWLGNRKWHEELTWNSAWKRESDREIEEEKENAGSTQRHQRTRRLLFICCCSSLLSQAKQAVGLGRGRAG